jgi:hypothetical protein
VLRAAGLKNLAAAFPSRFSLPKPLFRLPFTSQERIGPTFAIRTLDPEMFQTLKQYSKNHHATLNDLLLTALYRAMFITGFAPAGVFPMGLLGMWLVEFMRPLTEGPLYAIIQEQVPDHMQGRVFTIFYSSCQLITPAGIFLVSALGDSAGLPTWYCIAGGFSLAIALGGFLSPAIFVMEDPLDADREERVTTLT